ncbi:hypothetical protein SNE40_021888 [Patella caerulea]|uniref:Uncharacterized protein n=1 Tax=Patella caerulea TaxID=87958 RepID=A0AAN8IZG7_PATCE
MKLREFVANSLPRVRGKKKKNQSQKSTVVTKERCDGNAPKCHAINNSSNSVIYQKDNSRTVAYQPLSDTGTDDTYSRTSGNTERSPTSENESTCVDYHNSYLNTSLDETKYLAPNSKEVGSFLTDQEKSSLLIYSSDCERQNNTTRKSRSRIRTNPWLPSPSSTPYNASRAFPRVSTLRSPLPSPCDEHSRAHVHGDKDVFMETDVSPTTPGSTDSGFKSSISLDIKTGSCLEIVPSEQAAKFNRQNQPKHKHSKKKLTKGLKTSESFDSYGNAATPQKSLCLRSQTTFDIDNVSRCHDNGILDKLKWRNHIDLTCPTVSGVACFEWEQDNSCLFSPSVELSPGMFQIPEHNISFEYEETLEHQLDNPRAKRDPSNASIVDLLNDDVTKEVAVQTDFEDNEDSDWMTASSFDETVDTTNPSPRKLSLISDCMQESTDTGYSSLTRDGLLELDEDFQFVSNKENISNNLNSWLENKEHFFVTGSMGQSWSDKTVDRFTTDPINYMCQSWYEGASRDSNQPIPFDMTTSMYIPATEVMPMQDPFKERHLKTADLKSKRNPIDSAYIPVIENSPIIYKPILESPKLVPQVQNNNCFKDKQESPPKDTQLKSPDIVSPTIESNHEHMEMKSQNTSSPDLENITPKATSTPTDRTSRHRSKVNILDDVKSQLSSMNNRSTGRTKAKKPDIRKPRDNLDVIRDYLGYASFEDFYFAKQCPPLSTGRTLNQIKSSLEEKVDQLRQEKLIVEQKIFEAQEEERIKKNEKLRFQKQLHNHRKQLLIQTLHDLKDKLENQSERLQKSYSTILNLQSRFSHRNSAIPLLRA